MKTALTLACIAAFSVATDDSEMMNWLEEQIVELEKNQVDSEKFFLNSQDYSIQDLECFVRVEVPAGKTIQFQANFSSPAHAYKVLDNYSLTLLLIRSQIGWDHIETVAESSIYRSAPWDQISNASASLIHTEKTISETSVHFEFCYEATGDLLEKRLDSGMFQFGYRIINEGYNA